MEEKKVNRIKEVLAIFKTNGIRTSGSKLDLIIEFQDLIGRSTPDEITELWDALDAGEKRNLLWAVSCAESFEITVMVIQKTIGRDYKIKVQKSFNDEFEKLQKYETELNERTHAVEKREKEIEATIKAQQQIQEILNGLRG